MCEKIDIKGSSFNYYPIDLKNDGSEPRLDIRVAIENLKIFKMTADAVELPIMLMYGTLLGAIREGQFLKHDSDTDLVVEETDEDKLLKIIPDLEIKGLLLVRYEKVIVFGAGIIMYSFMRNGMWIDVYLLQRRRSCIICGIAYPSVFFEDLQNVSFYGEIYHIPNNVEDFLVLGYGADWRIPKENFHISLVKYLLRLRIYLGVRHIISILLRKILPRRFFSKLKKIVCKYG